MDCKHEQFKCTNGIFYCLRCGAAIPNPYEVKNPPEEKKPVKRRKKENGETEKPVE